MSIRKYADRSAFLHSKLYVIRGADQRTLIFGSSNLTYGGLASNVEFNAAEDYDPSTADPKWARVTAWFEDIWNHHALPLSEDDLRVIRHMAARGETPDQPHQPDQPEPHAETRAGETSYADHFMALQLRYLTLPLVGRVEPFWFQMQVSAPGTAPLHKIYTFAW